jgi:hypothetical protein
MAVDRAGNIYLAVRLSLEQVVLFMLEAGTRRPVQLAVIQAEANAYNAPRTLTVTPDGQQLLIAHNDGKVLKYSAPLQNAQPQLVAQVDTDVWCLTADDQT